MVTESGTGEVKAEGIAEVFKEVEILAVIVRGLGDILHVSMAELVCQETKPAVEHSLAGHLAVRLADIRDRIRNANENLEMLMPVLEDIRRLASMKKQ